MADINMVAYFRPFTDNRILQDAFNDSYVCTDIDVICDDHSSQVRDAAIGFIFFRIRQADGTDRTSGLNSAIIAYSGS